MVESVGKWLNVSFSSIVLKFNIIFILLFTLYYTVRVLSSARQIKWFGGVSHQKSFLSHQILPLVA